MKHLQRKGQLVLKLFPGDNRVQESVLQHKLSARWNPLGKSLPMVSLTTGARKPIRALGSLMLRSPSMAKDAVTPPVVGSVKGLTKGKPAWDNKDNLALVLAICMRLSPASIILAPPDLLMQMNGTPFDGGVVNAAGDLFTHHGSHAPSDEGEIHAGNHHRLAIHGA